MDHKFVHFNTSSFQMVVKIKNTHSANHNQLMTYFNSETSSVLQPNVKYHQWISIKLQTAYAFLQNSSLMTANIANILMHTIGINRLIVLSFDSKTQQNIIRRAIVYAPRSLQYYTNGTMVWCSFKLNVTPKVNYSCNMLFLVSWKRTICF